MPQEEQEKQEEWEAQPSSSCPLHQAKATAIKNMHGHVADDAIGEIEM